MSVTDLLESMGTAGEAVGARGEFMVPVADPVALRSHFAQEGYVVVRHAVPGSLCQAALAAFERDVKPSRAYFKRHASSDFERHVFTEAGFMKYPIMNLQDRRSTSASSGAPVSPSLPTLRSATSWPSCSVSPAG